MQRLGILCAMGMALLCVGVRADNRVNQSVRQKTAPGIHRTVSQRRRPSAGLRARNTVRQVAAGSRRKVLHSGAVARVNRGQRQIDGERAREIQQALIREKYLDGEPTGVWDQSTKDAMTRFQGDNGWQTKLVPDSRALIKLGLGPTHAGLIDSSSVLLPDSASGMRPGGADLP
jgi:hypothetical protein